MPGSSEVCPHAVGGVLRSVLLRVLRSVPLRACPEVCPHAGQF
jgi:hypothetical protein